MIPLQDFNSSSTFRLLARPSFLEGVGRIVDTSNSLQSYNRDRTGEEADAKALAGDWKTVGRDIETAAEQYEQEAVER